MENSDYPELERRLGRDLLGRRMFRQAGREARLLHQGEGFFKIERFIPLDAIVSLGLALTGLGRIARQGFLSVRVVRQEWSFSNLPTAFDGFQILQLSDLHIDLDTALVEPVSALIRQTPHDAAVITGDFRNRTEGDYRPAVEATALLLDALSPLRWAILGNHDFIEMVPSLEQAGLPVLLNESVFIERDNSRLWIAGIDDPHFYGTHDLAAARRPIPDGDFSILLAHSPEVHAEAAAAGFDLQLSGHTHGGQLCLPGGRPVVVPCKLPARFVSGRWTSSTMQGYTSPGTGSCGVAARLNCPPEITLHVLRSS